MSFTSINFLLFLLVVIVVNYCLPRKYRWIFLLASSFYFYLNWQPVYALLLIVSILVTYIGGRVLSLGFKENTRRWLLGGFCVLLFAPLIVFKYYGFLTENIHNILKFLHIGMEMPELNLLLPLGISFYTFSAVGYLIDCYREKYLPEKNIFILALFISFFAQISSGPIPRADKLIPQLVKPIGLSYNYIIRGLHMMVWGFFMKLCVADRIGIYVNAVYGNIENHNGGSMLLASFLYTIQIYCDFAGYSIIAIGVARMLGIKLMQNFKRPYFSKSMKEFWSRWHISLSTWFRDYVYFPLGGSRVSKKRRTANLITTFLVSGLWHGAAWNFIVWGGVHGTAQVIEKNQNTAESKRGRNALKILLVFIVVSFAWVFFRLSSMHEIGMFFNKLVLDFGVPFLDLTLAYVLLTATVLFIFDYIQEFHGSLMMRILKNFWVTNITCGFLLAMIMLFGVFGANSFIYFAF